MFLHATSASSLFPSGKLEKLAAANGSLRSWSYAIASQAPGHGKSRLHGPRSSGWRLGYGTDCLAFTLAARSLLDRFNYVRPDGGRFLHGSDLAREEHLFASMASVGFCHGSRGRRTGPPPRIHSRNLEDRTGRQSQLEPRTFEPVQPAFADIGRAAQGSFPGRGDAGIVVQGTV